MPSRNRHRYQLAITEALAEAGDLSIVSEPFLTIELGGYNDNPEPEVEPLGLAAPGVGLDPKTGMNPREFVGDWISQKDRQIDF